MGLSSRLPSSTTDHAESRSALTAKNTEATPASTAVKRAYAASVAGTTPRKSAPRKTTRLAGVARPAMEATTRRGPPNAQPGRKKPTEHAQRTLPGAPSSQSQLPPNHHHQCLSSVPPPRRCLAREPPTKSRTGNGSAIGQGKRESSREKEKAPGEKRKLPGKRGRPTNLSRLEAHPNQQIDSLFLQIPSTFPARETQETIEIDMEDRHSQGTSPTPPQ